ncbi:MAG: TrkH family potassium uptake protein [Planctomycetales bacterium]|nr:TrkH family potassium uptake protein [Planctomycetales bacterium]
MSYAIRLRVLLKYFGQYCLVLAILLLPPVLVAALNVEWMAATRYGLVALTVATLGGVLSQDRFSGRVQKNEAMVLVVGVFLFTSAVMVYPFMAEGLELSDACFESVSGCTTTGLSTTRTVEDKSVSFLFARAWMQWIGGLGVVVFSVALVVHPGVTAKRLMMMGGDQESLVGNTTTHARRTLVIYTMMTVVAIIGLAVTSGNLFESVAYACAAVSTGGFAPRDSSLAGVSGGWPTWVMASLACLAGAIPLVLYERAYQGDFRYVAKSMQLRAVLAFTGVACMATFACLWLLQDTPLKSALLQATMMGISAQTTAGFSVVDVTHRHPVTKLVLIAAMFIGGGLGSTAGGVKVWRVLVGWQLFGSLISRTCTSPHAVSNPHLAGQRLEEGEINEAAIIVGLYAVVIFLSWTTFVAFAYDPLDALFEVVSATGTVGLSTGITSIDLPVPLKTVLCCDMLLGRLEVFVFLVALYPKTWFGNRTELT